MYGHTREELLVRAKRDAVVGRYRMNKAELADAIGRAERRSPRPGPRR